jgi:hypothetical protein
MNRAACTIREFQFREQRPPNIRNPQRDPMRAKTVTDAEQAEAEALLWEVSSRKQRLDDFARGIITQHTLSRSSKSEMSGFFCFA